MFRGAIAILLGYLALTACFIMLTQSGGQSVSGVIVHLAGFVSALLGGWLCALVAKHSPIRFITILAVLAAMLSPAVGSAVGIGWIAVAVVLTVSGVALGGASFILGAVMKRRWQRGE